MIFREIAREYFPVVDARGQSLRLEIQDTGLGLTAMAGSDGVTHVVRIGREMLRSPRLTPDGLRIIFCHELGHLFGGAPRRPVPPEWDGPVAADGLSLLSAEGQADTYASLVCFRRLVRGQNHRAVLDAADSPRLRAGCDKAWGTESEDSLICQRAGWGGFNLLNLVKKFPISFETPDESVSARTLIGEYPARQCRLDTIVAAARCRDQASFVLDSQDPREGECSQPSDARPPCWYRSSAR